MNIIHFQPWGPNAEGFPEAWPYRIRENQEGKPLPAGWVEKTRDELDSYLDPMRAQYQAAKAALPVPPEAPTQEQVDEQADRDKAAEARVIYSAIRNNTATVAQRNEVLAFLLKREAKRMGLSVA